MSSGDSPGLSVQANAWASATLKLGPSKRSNPHSPCSEALPASAAALDGAAAALTTNPPRAGSARAGSSSVEPSFLVRRSTASCVYAVAKTTGAPSTGNTTGSLLAQSVSFGLAGCSAGNCDASTAGSATTSTDIG